MRVVLLGAPYGGSHSGAALAGNALGARMVGRSIREWLEIKKPTLFPGREIGVIAGTLRMGLGLRVAS